MVVFMATFETSWWHLHPWVVYVANGPLVWCRHSFLFFSFISLSLFWFPCLSLQFFKVAIPFVFPSTLVYVLFIIIFVYFKWLIKLGLCFSFNSLQLFYLTYLIFIVLIAICFFYHFLDLFCFLILDDWEFCFVIFFICLLWNNLVLWPESRVSDISMIWLQSFSLRFFVYFYFF